MGLFLEKTSEWKESWKEWYVFGTCKGFSHGDKKWISKGTWPPVALFGWLEGDRRLIKCCPEQLRPASEREELLEFFGGPESHQGTWDFSRVASALGGNELDDISGEVPDLATWQREK